MKLCVLVIGPGRSGSSALTRVLSLGGATLPQRIMPANEGNPLGYWESQAAAEANERFLIRNKTSFYDSTLRVQDAKPDDLDGLHAYQDEIRSCIGAEFGEAGTVVLKDPRISCLMPYWLAALEELAYQVRAIHIFRSPSEFAASLYKRQMYPREQAMKLWIKYTLCAERGSRGIRRCFVHCDSLFADWRMTCGHIINELELPLGFDGCEAQVDDFLAQGLPRHLSEDQQSNSADQIYRWLQQAVREPDQDSSDLDEMYRRLSALL